MKGNSLTNDNFCDQGQAPALLEKLVQKCIDIKVNDLFSLYIKQETETSDTKIKLSDNLNEMFKEEIMVKNENFQDNSSGKHMLF